MAQDAVLGPTVALRGRIPFTSERSARAYRLNQCLASLREEKSRQAFLADAEAFMASFGLTEHECALMRQRDFTALQEYGACLLSLGSALDVMGLTLVEFGALARGQTAADFVAHKRAQSKGQAWQF
ncbi:MAG: hypothetical protein RL559_286 [Pseudomonadota bacterium]|jgi:gallate dioxygenase